VILVSIDHAGHTPDDGMPLASEGAGGVERVCAGATAIAAHSAQTELASKCPDGRWARSPLMTSANTVSMTAWHGGRCWPVRPASLCW
jgi:hypothetical protein